MMDSIDRDKYYMKSVVTREWWPAKWANYNSWFENIAIPKLQSLDVEGTMIFTGVYTGEDYSRLKKLFPKLNIIGIDAVKYTDEDIIVEDVRTYLPSISTEIDIMWNGIGPWPWSEDTKLSCFLYAKQHLNPGGLYIDHIHTVRDKPIIANDPAFRIVDEKFFMMEKI